MRSSGRMGMALVMSLALLVGGGCKHQTPEQKAQGKLAKQQASEAKAQAKAQEKQAKAQAKAQADAAHKQAEADKKATAQAQKQAEAQAKADKKAAEQKAAEDKHNAELAAKEQKHEADAMAREQKKHGHAAHAEAPVVAHADTRAHDIEPVGPTVNFAPAEAMTLAAHQGYGTHEDDNPKVIGYPQMKPENYQRLFDQHAQTMAAEGQAEDATLSDADFDGAELNATGRSNLALALQAARANNKLTLYVGTTRGNDEMMGDRAAAIDRYIKSSPWSSVAVTTRHGLNTTNTTSVLPGINALKRLDKEAGGSGNNSMTSSGADTTGGRSRMGSGSSSSGSSSSGQ
jgi:hypothetical protein